MIRVLTATLAILLASCSPPAQAPAPSAPQPAVQNIAEFSAVDTGAWFDSSDVADIDRDARPDIASADGNNGIVFWYRHGSSRRDWTRVTVWDNADKSLGQIQAVAAGSFTGDGQVDIVSGDQTHGAVVLHRHGGDPNGAWRKAVLVSGRAWLQSVVPFDVDGDRRLDIVYAFEGAGQGSGGVHWLRFKGGDAFDPANWQDHVMASHEGAWALRVPRYLDMDNDGVAAELVFSARNLPVRNAATRPGLYYLTRPSDPASPWKETAIGVTPDDTINFDVGDYFGRSDGRDVSVVDLRAGVVYLFDAGRNWARTEIGFPQLIAGAPIQNGWSVATIPDSQSGHNSLFAVMSAGPLGHAGIFAVDHVDGAYKPRLLRLIPNAHPYDNRVVATDLDGDGRKELVTSNSGGGELVWIEFKPGEPVEIDGGAMGAEPGRLPAVSASGAEPH